MLVAMCFNAHQWLSMTASISATGTPSLVALHVHSSQLGPPSNNSLESSVGMCGEEACSTASEAHSQHSE
jgi:hypothetical protein